MSRPPNPFSENAGGGPPAALPAAAGGWPALGSPGAPPAWTDAPGPDLPAAVMRGGAAGRGGALPATLVPAAPGGVEQAFELAALNPLVAAAAPLLWVAARLGESEPVEDVPLFRSRVVEEVDRFETAAMARGVSSRSALVARYALCATIDDIVLNTEWGAHSDWPLRGLVGVFYQESWGGERFFDLLGQLHGRPEETVDALELMAVCLGIGFVGKFRVAEGGTAQLARLRAELYRTIRRVRGPHERALTPSFPGIARPYAPPARTRWLWAAAGGTVAALAALYLAFALMLSRQIDAAADRVAALAPALPVLVMPAPPGRDTRP